MRFLQTDPIPGGSANAYDYCTQDPINCTDLNGQFGWSSIGHFFKKAAKRLLHNSFVRGFAIGLAISAICAGSAGVGCALAVGAAAGGGLGLLDHFVNHNRGPWEADFALGALQGATNGVSGAIFRHLSRGVAGSAFRFLTRSVPGTIVVNGFLAKFRGFGY